MKKRLLFALSLLLCFTGFFAFFSCEKTQEVGSRYEINAEYSPQNQMLAGTVKLTYTHREESEISVLKFALYPNAYREDAAFSPVQKEMQAIAFYQGESFGEMVISSVHGAKNWEIEGEDENILCAYLPQSLFYGDKIVLDIGFMVKLANVHHRTGVAQNAVNLGNFYPVLCGTKNGGFYENAYYNLGSPFYHDFSNYTLHLKIPKEYTIASTGEIVSEKILESKKEYTVSAMNVQDLGVVASKNYKIAHLEHNGNNLRYYYYRDENPSETLLAAAECLDYFEQTFGQYPYPVYTLAQTGLCLESESYPALCLLSEQLEKGAREKQIAVQTARQWWGMCVGANRVENAWQDIGLAEYSALCFFENYEKYGVKRETQVQEALKEYRSYYDVYGSVLGRTDTAMTRHLKDFIGAYEYQCLEIDKAIVMFDTLRKGVGEKSFFAGLKRYYKECAGQKVMPEHLIGAFERAGVDTNGFFHSFLSGKAIL